MNNIPDPIATFDSIVEDCVLSEIPNLIVAELKSMEEMGKAADINEAIENVKKKLLGKIMEDNAK